MSRLVALQLHKQQTTHCVQWPRIEWIIQTRDIFRLADGDSSPLLMNALQSCVGREHVVLCGGVVRAPFVVGGIRGRGNQFEVIAPELGCVTMVVQKFHCCNDFGTWCYSLTDDRVSLSLLCNPLLDDSDKLGERDDVVGVTACLLIERSTTRDDSETWPVDISVYRVGREVALGEVFDRVCGKLRTGSVRPADDDSSTRLQIP